MGTGTITLWGPGTITDAAAWYAEHRPDPDECDHLDRTFLIRHHDDRLYLPVRSEIAAELPPSERTATWYTIQADHPNDAYHHVRNIVTSAGCQRRGQCQNCHAETLQIGPHSATATGTSGRARTPTPSEAATPGAHPRSQPIQI